MVILRDGIDKVMFTVRVKDDYTEHKYPKELEMIYGNRLKRLKFSDRFAWTIEFNKELHDSWKFGDDLKQSWGIQYFFRLDGLRQMRVLLNAMRLYNLDHGLPLYDKRLHDDNVVIPSRIFSTIEFIKLIKERILDMKLDYQKIRKELFDEDIAFDKIVVDTHQLEYVIEGIGMHTSDVEDTFRDYARCETFKVYHSQTRTMYFNSSEKRQLKIYQKGVGILRLEATLNQRVQDIVMDWKESDQQINLSIDNEIRNLMEDMNIPRDWYRNRKMSKDQMVYIFAEALGLYTDSGVVDTDLFKVLLESTHFQSKTDTRDLVRQLIRKRLLKRQSRGICVPTQRLIGVQQLFKRLEEVGDIFEIGDELE